MGALPTSTSGSALPADRAAALSSGQALRIAAAERVESFGESAGAQSSRQRTSLPRVRAAIGATAAAAMAVSVRITAPPVSASTARAQAPSLNCSRGLRPGSRCCAPGAPAPAAPKGLSPSAQQGPNAPDALGEDRVIGHGGTPQTGIATQGRLQHPLMHRRHADSVAVGR